MRRSADEWAAFAFEILHASPVKAQDPIATTSMMGASKCKSCGAPKRCMKFIEPVDGLGDPRFVCTLCHAAWIAKMQTISMGEVRVAPRPGAVGERMDNALEMKKAIMSLIDTGSDAKVYVAFAIGFTVKRLVKGSKRVGFTEGDLTEWQIRQAIDRGRALWGQTLKCLGIRTP